MSRKVAMAAGLLVVAGACGLIVVPSLLRARVSGGESPVIGDTRTVISAQAAYASSNNGFYAGRLECLSGPSACLPGYAPDAPTFLDAYLASAQTKSGYVRRFVPGPAVSPVDIAKRKLGRDSVVCWAYVSTPVSADTGIRTYCGDCNGIVCSRMDGRAPAVRDGECVECDILR